MPGAGKASLGYKPPRLGSLRRAHRLCGEALSPSLFVRSLSLMLEHMPVGDDFLTTLWYRSAQGDLCELRFEGEDEETRVWWFSVNAGDWEGPFSRIDREVVLPEDAEDEKPEGFHPGGMWASDMGKHDALRAAAHHLGRSGAEADWRPASLRRPPITV